MSYNHEMHPLLHEYNKKKVNFMQYNKWNNCIEKTCVINHFIIAKMFQAEMNIPLKGETNREPTKKRFNLFNSSNFKFLLQKNL